MREAIDYNALSWVRQELAETLKQARHCLEEYAGNQSKEALQGCAAHLHEARGPLRMVDLKGADLLTGEMEEVIADLLLDSIGEPETALEQLMQGFLELPEYLYSLRPGRADRPEALFPLINSLRASRGEQPLGEVDTFSPDLSVRVPAAVFDVRAEHPQQDTAALARAARVRFQGGLLDWYRNGEQGDGLQTLVDVLDHLLDNAGSEPVARLWWVSAVVAELLRDGNLQVTPGIKRLFGQVDRQIKRLLDQGEAVFADILTDDLLKNLLFHIDTSTATSPRVDLVRTTYGLGTVGETPDEDDDLGIAGCSEELLQTVSGTVREDIVRIKEQLDAYMRNDRGDSAVLASVIEELHALGNMLGMIGMDRLGNAVSGSEQLLRDSIDGSHDLSEADFVEMANMLVAIEDALADINASIGRQQAGAEGEDVTFLQGQEAVVEAVMSDMTDAKESINGFLRSSGDFELLDDVPLILNRIYGGLKLAGQERLSAATSMVHSFVTNELLKGRRELSEGELDSLADAICSIEYCVEELAENRDFGNRAMDIAEESLDKLGYATSVAEEQPPEQPETAADEVPEDAAAEPAMSAVDQQEQPVDTAVPTAGDAELTSLQIIDSEGDPEIIEIFIEEAAEELEKISALIPGWCDNPVDREPLTEIRRSFHTMKGSGRMVGAMATGEFSWAMEDIVNRLLDESLQANDDVVGVLRQSPMALTALLEQVKDPARVLTPAINDLARQAQACVQQAAIQPVVTPAISADEAPVPGEHVTELVESTDEPSVPDEQVAELPETAADVTAGSTAAQVIDEVPVPDADAFPVLAEDADAEIVEIFLEEATEEYDRLAAGIPAWVAAPESGELAMELRRSFHTLKGSGRMAGAMRVGEYCWIVEEIFNRLNEGRLEQSASLFAYLVRVPDALSQLLDQVRNGIEPDIDIQSMLAEATVLVNGCQLEETAGSVTGEPADAGAGQAGVAENVDAAEDDPSLIEIFSVECREHLQTIERWVAAYDEPGVVTDGLYRALHTLSGIAESAEMPAIGRLADGLYAWFGQLYEEQRQVDADGHEVLRDCAAEIARLLDALPDRNGDDNVLEILETRIAVLPPVDSMPEATAEDIARGHAIDAVPAEVADQQPDSSPQLEDVEEVVDLPDTDIAMAGDLDELPEITAALPADAEADVVAHEPELPAAAGPEPAAVDVTEVDADGIASTGEAEIPVADSTESAADPYADMDPELYEIFVEESTEVMDAGEAALRGWSQEPEDAALMAEFQRHLHTLKGSARMVDLGDIGDLSHAVESVMTEVTEGRAQPSADLFGLLADALDRLAEMLEQVRNRESTVPASDIETVLQTFIDTGEVTAVAPAAPASEAEQDAAAGTEVEAEAVADEQQPAAEIAEQAVPDDDEDVPEYVLDAPPPPPPGERVAPPRLVVDREQQTQSRGEQVKVQSEMLDVMVNHAGEINIYRARMEQQISDYRFNLSELDQTIGRLREQLRQLEMETEAQILYRYEQESDQRHQDFDPLEMDRYSTLQQLSRSLMESISDLRSLQEIMENTTRDSETLLLQQSRVSTELQENLIRTRMIPFASLSPRLRRIARQSARQLDKKVEVNLVGEDGEMDRAVVERIIAPLEHMLRNSVAHGIEAPRIRKAAGKPVTGKIDIEFERDGSEIVLRITDDGAGMNISAIRERAVERGLMTADSELEDEDVIQFVLQTGFSTATEVTQISGRGVGMDVVNSEVKQLGGSLHIESESGKGATFTVRLPYTLAINQGMLVTAGEETFCVPLASVEGVVRFYPEELRECYGDGQQLFDYGANQYRLQHLGSLLETGSISYPGEREQVPVLLVRAGDKRIGFHVEGLQGIREVVIKPIGPQLSTVDGISGATILGDGRVVMILDMVAVSRREVTAPNTTGRASADRSSGELVVMVVDDSITVRKVTTRLLERNGYRVVTAKDGVDAMGKLQESAPDIMLLDIEMPRMDGFELATHMRNDDALRHVPIIMITSRTGDKHRERAEQIGVQSYLGKPYQEADLLDSIHQIIGVTDDAAEG